MSELITETEPESERAGERHRSPDSLTSAPDEHHALGQQPGTEPEPAAKRGVCRQQAAHAARLVNFDVVITAEIILITLNKLLCFYLKGTYCRLVELSVCPCYLMFTGFLQSCC